MISYTNQTERSEVEFEADCAKTLLDLANGSPIESIMIPSEDPVRLSKVLNERGINSEPIISRGLVEIYTQKD